MISKFLRLIGVLVVLLSLYPYQVHASLPYPTYSVDTRERNERMMSIQPIYEPSMIVSGSSLGLETGLNGPKDIFIDQSDYVYIADTGNHRILKVASSGELQRVIGDKEGEGKLNAPEGVYVDAEGTIYVADTGNRRIAIFSSEGKYQRAIGELRSSYLPDTFGFSPINIMIDARGLFYIQSRGAFQGLIQLDAKEEFKGFFGPNKVSLSALDRLKRVVLSDEQLAKEAANRPIEIYNVAMDHEGYIYTLTQGVYRDQVKKLNPAGINVLVSGAFNRLDFGGSPNNADIAVDRNRFMYVVDQQAGAIRIYSPHGEPLFEFGQASETELRFGLFGAATSLAINSTSDLWIVDSRTGLVQVFQRSEFGEAVLQGTAMLYKGDYKGSEPYWTEVISNNDIINNAYRGLGKLELQEEQYAAALQYFERSYDAEGYSQSFWYARYEWLTQYFVFVLGAIVLLYIALKWMPKLTRPLLARMPVSKQTMQFGEEIKNIWNVMLHPYEGFYRLKEARVSKWTIVVLGLLIVAASLISSYWTGFIFNPVDRSSIQFIPDLLFVVTLWLTWTIANYLVSVIKDGEGRLSEVFQASLYAMAPIFVLGIPLTLLSNVVVLEEGAIISFLQSVKWVWIFILMFVMTQVIHNFDFIEALKAFVITIVTIVIIWIFLLILFGLVMNLYNFVFELVQEVSLI